MKKSLLLLTAVILGGLGHLAAADILLKDFKAGLSAMGSYKNNASIQFSIDSSQIKSRDVLRIDYEIGNEGYCGVYDPLNQNWSDATGLKVFCKGTPGKIMQLTLIDADNRYFIYDILFTNSDWTVYDIPIGDFSLNPFFQPKDVVNKSDVILLGNIKQIQFAPTQPGKGTLFINQVIVEGAAERKKRLFPSAQVQGGYIFYNRRIDFLTLENYTQYCAPIELADEHEVTTGVWQGYRFLNGVIYLMADAKNLYVAMTVGETNPAFNGNTRGNLWNGDCLELYLGFDKELKRHYGPKDFQIGISPGKGKVPPSLWVFNLNKELKGAHVTADRNDTGYSLKAQIPLDELGVNDLDDGQSIFLDAALDKGGSDGNRVLQLTWNGKGLSYLDPTQWTYGIVSSNRSEAMDTLSRVLQEQWFKKQNDQIVIDGKRLIGKINPLVYGINAFPAAGTPGGWMDYSDPAVQLYKGINLTLLRFPGGDWGDEHKLEPAHLAKFIELCRKLRAEPMVQVRLHKGSAAEAAALVELCNRQKNYKVKYWALGNEPDYFETRHFPNEKYRVADYIRDFKAFSRAMKKVDPKIIICGPELAQYVYNAKKPDAPLDKDGLSWMETFLKECGNSVDLVTFHHYPLGGANGVADWKVEALLNTVNRWDETIPGLRRKIFEITHRAIPVGVTEINSDWSGLSNGEATPDTFGNALWWTMTLGDLITQRVDLVSFFSLYDTGSSGIVTRELGTLPAYAGFEFYKDFGDQLLLTQNSNDFLKVYAARSGRTTRILFVNRHTTIDVSAEIKLRNLDRVRSISTRRYSEYEFVNNQKSSLNTLPFSETLDYTFPHFSITEFIIE